MVELSEATYKILKEVAQSPDDARLLLDVVGTDYEEFSAFVKDMGLEEDENAKQIKEILKEKEVK